MCSRDSTNLPFRLCVCVCVCLSVEPFVPGCWQRRQRVYARLVPFGARRRANVWSRWRAALSSACSLHLATGAGHPAHVQSILYWPAHHAAIMALIDGEGRMYWHGFRVEWLKRVIFCIWRFSTDVELFQPTRDAESFLWDSKRGLAVCQNEIWKEGEDILQLLSRPGQGRKQKFMGSGFCPILCPFHSIPLPSLPFPLFPCLEVAPQI